MAVSTRYNNVLVRLLKYKNFILSAASENAKDLGQRLGHVLKRLLPNVLVLFIDIHVAHEEGMNLSALHHFSVFLLFVLERNHLCKFKNSLLFQLDRNGYCYLN